ncbi:hypothetical protein BC829DRAFT_393203 [Chytridium lagenaria]|nr:hypothetical protein BC829DRAFT_393203 [Chytridium lagenaria]
MTSIGICSYILVWISQPRWWAIESVYKSFIPMVVFTGMITSCTINTAKQSSLLAGFLHHFTNSIAFAIVFSGYMCLAVICFHLSNEREVIFGYVYNLFLLGVGFPILRYVVIFCNRSAISAWRSPKPTSRPQEIANNASKVVISSYHVFMTDFESWFSS